ncbi:MAG: DUF167 domain-containing protein [bacterium]
MTLRQDRSSRPSATPALPVASFRLKFKVTPNARRTELTALRDGVLYAKVAAPPRDGRANTELLTFLKTKTGFNPRLIHGESSRLKLIEFPGAAESFVLARLLSPPPGARRG